MNIKPMAQGSGVPAASDAGGRSASPTRMEAAKAVAEGRQPAPDRQVERAQNDLKRIKMHTQRSVWRDGNPNEVDALDDNAPTPSDINDTVETTVAVPEETRPLSPQFAALAKAKRELQVKESSLLAREKALADQGLGKPTQEALIAKLKADPLSVLQEHGVTYDQLTEAILSNQSERNPTVLKLEEEIKAIKAGLEGRDKSQVDRDNAQKQQVLTQMANDADKIIAQGDEYEMVRETGSRPDVIRLIEETFDKTGEVLDVEEALQLVENELIEESLKIARIKKIQGRLTPAPQAETQTKPINPNVRIMRTLTNRDGASVPSSAKERAIAAFHGRNK
jgi:hypothetical protein